MADVRVALPKPEIKGIGHVLYRCAGCGELMEPTDAVIAADQSYHPAHLPENDTDAR